MGYYDDLDLAAAPPWVRVGWRQQLEQVYRFEAALELLVVAAPRVLDVGCGLGALAEYADRRGVERDWVGIEPRENFARQASTRHEVIAQPFENARVPESSFDAAIAVGTLAGSTAEVEALVQFLHHAAPAFLLVVLDRAGLATRPALAVEHASRAVDIDTLTSIGLACDRSIAVERLSPTDLALFAWRDPAPRIRTVLERFEATVSGPWGSEEPPVNKAWLACELGLREQARGWLSRATDSPLSRVVAQRIAQT